MVRRIGRLRRSAGTLAAARPAQAQGAPWPSGPASAYDIAAVDQGERRSLFGYFRGLYGSYPRKFRGYMIDLTPDGLALRPLLLLGFPWRRASIREQFSSARVRPFADASEERRFLATGHPKGYWSSP